MNVEPCPGSFARVPLTTPEALYLRRWGASWCETCRRILQAPKLRSGEALIPRHRNGDAWWTERRAKIRRSLDRARRLDRLRKRRKRAEQRAAREARS